MKWLIPLMVIFMLPMTFALEECKGKLSTDEVPCLIFLPSEDACGTIEVSFYQDNTFLHNQTMHQYTDFYCNATFNYSSPGSYVFEYTTGDTGSIIVEVEKMLSVALLLIPLGMGFLFLYWGNTLNDDQEGLKWFTRLLAVLMMFPLFIGANILINQSNALSGFETIFNLTWLTWIFYTIIAVVLIYIIWKVYSGFQMKKSDELEQGILK